MTTSLSYDANGNLTSKTGGGSTATYTWDFENRLSSATVNGVTTNFKYDPFGRRVYKSSSGANHVYVYDGDNLIEELNLSGTEVAHYTPGPGIDEPLAELRSGTTSFYETDGLGSITSLSNAAGALANTYTYDSLGNLTASTGGVTNPFQFTARELDNETGLYYYRARYYDQTTGRFLNEDPLGAGNLYPYVDNNPINNSDPFGLFPVWDHRAITRQAALNAGYSEADANALADLVAGVDSLPGSQEADADAANLHAMSGKKKNGSYQKCSEAYAGSQAQVERYLANGNPAAIAAAIHIIQDSYSPAHAGYQEWNGGYTRWHIPGLGHLWGDGAVNYSSARLNALVATQQLLRDLNDRSSSLQYPTNYLNQCNCKQ